MTSFLGVDTGGTFTDFVLLDENGRLTTHKVLSTPQSPELAILQGINELQLRLEDASIVHGSTVATNALLERKGVSVAYVTNKGLGDVLTIGRQARPQLYQLQPQPIQSPVAQDLIFEIDTRLAADGSQVVRMSDDDLVELVQAVEQAGPEAVAINLLFSFIDPRDEQRIAQSLTTIGFVCCSSQVLPEYKEYERGIATWLNAYVGPLMQGYLRRLKQGVSPASLSIMQSSGGTIDAEHAASHSVRLLLSGPAGGLQGARFIGKLCGESRLLTFDMGGTSTDVALIDDQIRLTNEGRIGDLPVAVPMVDMHTIGAGGGSIAWFDAGGMLQVGPQSAGAAPGPACYGKGGQQATVTDANLVLGRLQAHAFLGGGMSLDIDAARRAIEPLARQLGCDIESAAQGIIGIANEHMAQALRVISVQRGEDPRDYVLTSFGGAGGLHVCDLADSLGVTRALVPLHCGVLSALGMLVAPHSQEFSRTVTQTLDQGQSTQLETVFGELELLGQQALVSEGIAPEQVDLQHFADLRYLGQSYTLSLPWKDVSSLVADFHATHQRRFGHSLQEAVELVNLRVRVSGPEPHIELSQIVGGQAVAQGDCRVWDIDQPVRLFQRDDLTSGFSFAGPALVAEKVATTWLKPGWTCRLDNYGNLLLKKLEQPE